MEELFVKNGHFASKDGAIYQLRGVNLSGSAKLPLKPDGTTHFDQTTTFDNHKNVSFVGRPLKEDQAEEHFDRLRKWGFNFLRFLITWEAIEHKGPGKYDNEYIDYVERMVSLAAKKGFYLFIDPHQDVWSRFTGGDGAPGWTLEELGMNISKIRNSETAIVHHHQGKNYRRMSWPLNYQKYSCATMFSLFFGGKEFAPDTKIDGRNVQDFLQDHYIDSVLKIVRKLKKYKNVIGFDTLNEPSPGWIGKKNLGEFDGFGFGKVVKSSPFQEMYLSEGRAVSAAQAYMLGFWSLPFGKVRLNPEGVPLWERGHQCIWRNHGVWDYDPNGAPMMLKPEYFYKKNGRKYEFYSDFMYPFIKKFKERIQKLENRFHIFIESDPSKLELEWKEIPKKNQGSVINATHWYDISVLMLKRYLPWFGVHVFKQKPIFGKENIDNAYEETIRMIREMSEKKMGNCPTVIGETGIPMDLNHRVAYLKNDYGVLEKALDRIMKAVEKNFVNLALWNYTPDHTHSLGDRWNEEDLSIYSQDTPSSYDEDGGRAVRAFSRPYPIRTKGFPVALTFDMERSLFKYAFRQEGDLFPETEIFIPEIHYKKGFEVLVNAGTYQYDFRSRVLKFKGEKGILDYGITVYPSKKSLSREQDRTKVVPKTQKRKTQ
ncbi:Glycosyl hydrolase family 35 domain protein [Leptospira interrogans serovar Manilae]|uniref:Glycosyl hydrolase family 35 domain protein n=1 Tax=Leptospira interrogans serovar Manilae TaxID=214675 RepID=A0AAQ1NXC3_LEPIR|nr:cellulase family glycosylhydrolase [Leptospira interrogans]AKP28092.1 glycosyl hydrolase family 35 [Leptospira interrogans serovar Manilae]AKP31874.1 glycosyl hydrolase family 35 [Leptospira interrogans serovar Manilae]EYU62931.1 glycosyl hydrolase family 35 [Leptospira interrogans serovar Manilae]SOR61216.1 Glycosyl hydrolase family 35 domain protein [Leptospira interrogans serovar Manilae]